MPNRPPTYRPRGDKPRPPDPRPKTAARGYGSRWRRLRLAFLREHPLCAACHAKGLIVAATDVDHKTLHRGDPDLMWSEANFQSLCHGCHSAKSAREG